MDVISSVFRTSQRDQIVLLIEVQILTLILTKRCKLHRILNISLFRSWTLSRPSEQRGPPVPPVTPRMGWPSWPGCPCRTGRASSPPPRRGPRHRAACRTGPTARCSPPPRTSCQCSVSSLPAGGGAGTHGVKEPLKNSHCSQNASGHEKDLFGEGAYVTEVPQDSWTDAQAFKQRQKLLLVDLVALCGPEQVSPLTSTLVHHVELLQVELFAHPGVIGEVVHGKAHHVICSEKTRLRSLLTSVGAQTQSTCCLHLHRLYETLKS